MNTHSFFPVLLIAAAAMLSSCAPWQAAGTRKDGTPYLVQSGGVWHKMKGGVLIAKNGELELKQILEEPDGVIGPQGVIDMKTTLGLAGLWKDEAVNADNNKTKVDLKKEDTAQIPLKADGEAKVIGAQAAAAEAATP